jgi:hypothetical protein
MTLRAVDTQSGFEPRPGGIGAQLFFANSQPTVLFVGPPVARSFLSSNSIHSRDLSPRRPYTRPSHDSFPPLILRDLVERTAP